MSRTFDEPEPGGLGIGTMLVLLALFAAVMYAACWLADYVRWGL